MNIHINTEVLSESLPIKNYRFSRQGTLCTTQCLHKTLPGNIVKLNLILLAPKRHFFLVLLLSYEQFL